MVSRVPTPKPAPKPAKKPATKAAAAKAGGAKVAGSKTAKATRGRQPGTRRDDIIAAAAEQFAVRGLAGVSMRDIAAAVGFNMSALYHHFPSKADLYRDVCIWAFEYAASYSAERLFSEGDTKARLRRYIASQVNFAEENGVAARIIQQEMLLAPSGIYDYPSIIKQLGLKGTGTSLADFITELNPPVLKYITALRLAEIIWDTIYAIARYRPAHLRLIGRDAGKKDGSAVSEVWVLICKLLDIMPEDDED